MKKLLLTTAVIALLSLSIGVQAALITTTFTGNGSGTLAGSSFLRSDFTITSVGDTDNRVFISTDNIYWLLMSTSSINIQGIGDFNFSQQQQVFCNQNNSAVGFSRADGSDLFDMYSVPSSSSWDMSTSFGPVSTNTGSLMQWTMATVNTSKGVLIFNTNSSIPSTFTAVVGVPEPSSIIALLGGLVGVFGLRRRKA